MYVRIEQCPVCKHREFTNQFICEDHTVSKESFALVTCNNCELLFTNPRPEESRLGDYYASEDYISHTDRANSPLHLMYKLVRKYTLHQKLKLINKVNGTAGSLLDFGCGTGDFLKKVNQHQWDAYGYEPDTTARNLALKKNPNKIIEELTEANHTFDIITAWHVLEHVPDLEDTILLLKSLLKKGGHLILALPNHRSFDATYYKSFWAGYDVPRHLYHFDKKSMKSLVKTFNFKWIDTLPMKFDAYYVSLLSEKYKGTNNLPNAVRVGYLSNKKARHTGEYSSLIYLLRK